MDASNDYYATLGVLPSAEDIVIRAAYKALAQRYHPDRFEGLKDEALRRMQEINEAYAVLSDPAQRKEYDKLRGSNTQSGDSYFGDDTNDVPPHYDPLEKDWAFAVKYYPDLPTIEARLTKIAWRLGYSFRAYMLEEKAFEKREQVAEAMERNFLESYFGTNPKLIAFAKKMIEGGHKKALKALNEAVRILGSNTDPDRIVNQIRNDELPRSQFSKEILRLARRIADDPSGTIELKWDLLQLLGGYFTWEGTPLFSSKCSAMYLGQKQYFASGNEFSSWLIREVIPNIVMSDDSHEGH